MSGIEFCCSCGRWVAAADGILRPGPDGTEVICSECRALETGDACPVATGTTKAASLTFIPCGYRPER